MLFTCHFVTFDNKISKKEQNDHTRKAGHIMKLKITWGKPVPLVKAKDDEGQIYSLDENKIPDAAGIYVFARRFGKRYEALYVGKSTNLRARVHGHLNNLKLMKYLQNAKIGKRVVIIGQISTLPGQKPKSVINTLERAFIRHFLAEGHDLVNQQGTIIRRHEILSEGKLPKSFIPSLMYLEKGKGE